MIPNTAPVNPFDSAAALAQSNCCVFDGKRLVRDGDGPAPSPRTVFVHDGFRALILNEHFSCVAAKSAVRQGNYRFGLYDALGSVPACSGLARDLFAFVRADADAATPREFRTFVASFDGPLPPDEATFERLLWTTLQRLHDLDVVHHEWDRRSKADAADPEFCIQFCRDGVLRRRSARRQFPDGQALCVADAGVQPARAIRSPAGDRTLSALPAGDQDGRALTARRHQSHARRLRQPIRSVAVLGTPGERRVALSVSRQDRRPIPGHQSKRDAMGRQRIEPQRGCAFVMSRGDTLRVIDPSGEQVADFVAFAQSRRRRVAVVRPHLRLQQHHLPDARATCCIPTAARRCSPSRPTRSAVTISSTRPAVRRRSTFSTRSAGTIPAASRTWPRTSGHSASGAIRSRRRSTSS